MQIIFFIYLKKKKIIDSFCIFENFFYWIWLWKSAEPNELKVPKSKLEKKLLIPTSNFWKYAPGADSAAAEVGSFWHF